MPGTLEAQWQAILEEKTGTELERLAARGLEVARAADQFNEVAEAFRVEAFTAKIRRGEHWTMGLVQVDGCHIQQVRVTGFKNMPRERLEHLKLCD
jgi:hypothetical protein